VAQPLKENPAAPEIWRLFRIWLALLVLGGAEFAASFLPLPRSLRPLVILPAVLMVAIVAIGFMEVKRGSVLARTFAIAAVFWLLVLLALGTADPLTRTDYRVPDAQVK
jgi:caa(3)-type oxidase subunit IV